MKTKEQPFRPDRVYRHYSKECPWLWEIYRDRENYDKMAILISVAIQKKLHPDIPHSYLDKEYRKVATAALRAIGIKRPSP